MQQDKMQLLTIKTAFCRVNAPARLKSQSSTIIQDIGTLALIALDVTGCEVAFSFAIHLALATPLGGASAMCGCK
jgi:hypothetical protein